MVHVIFFCAWCPQEVGDDVWREGKAHCSTGKEVAKERAKRCLSNVCVHSGMSTHYLYYAGREKNDQKNKGKILASFPLTQGGGHGQN